MSGPFRATLIAAGTTGTTTSQPVDCSGTPYVVVYYTSAGTTSGGTIILEEADFSGEPNDPQPYPGTWSQIESRAASSFTGGVTIAVHLTVGAYGFIRARISSAITGGGSITVVARGTP